MKISLHISGLIIIVAGLIFIASAIIAKSVWLYIVAAVCIICGIFWLLPKSIKMNLRSGKPKSRSQSKSGGRYSR